MPQLQMPQLQTPPLHLPRARLPWAALQATAADATAALAKGKATLGSPAGHTGAEAEPNPSIAAPLFDDVAAARLSEPGLKAISEAKAWKKKPKARAASRGFVAEANLIAALAGSSGSFINTSKLCTRQLGRQ